MKVLIVEDTVELARALRDFFALGGHSADIAGDLSSAQDYLSVSHFDMVLLDIMLPDGDGRGLLKSIRKRDDSIPIIVMTAKSEISDRIDVLDIGADDYIVKPFEFAELEARCRAVLRRQKGQNQTKLSYGSVSLFPLLATLEFKNKQQNLRNRELRLLEIFFNNPEMIHSKEQLTDRLFSLSEEVTDNTIEVYVGRVRKKLVGSGLEIITMRGLGYRLRLCDA
ncbi:MAG: DNA-binding response regulator [Alphaproteobacteria bacterium]|jgi:DNA-binding response OmpR family regulator|nr:DNA-binding response regulator [Alphaproteobacteria bacterium]